MEEKTIQLKSIWGKWWLPIRKWFYSTWLLYELTIRFYDYSIATHHYFLEMEALGEFGAMLLATICGVLCFSICTFYLTLPACYLLFKFFKVENVTGTSFEKSIKIYF